jgi:tRNA G18 (ribose-2'-O)-methylase SpoU
VDLAKDPCYATDSANFTDLIFSFDRALVVTGQFQGNEMNVRVNDDFQTSLHVVLFQPEIPQNTGNIGRTCVALGAKLWLVRPVAFRLDSSHLKRAGMDYWQDLNWECVENWDALEAELADSRMWLVTKFGF